MEKKNKVKKPWYKRVWLWIGVVVLIAIVAGASGGSKDSSEANTSESNNTPTTQSEAPQEAETTKWDLESSYEKLTTGMTKAQVEEATGKTSDNCTETDMGQYGKTESCSYGNPFIDKASILVIYSNGELQTKSKSTY